MRGLGILQFQLLRLRQGAQGNGDALSVDVPPPAASCIIVASVVRVGVLPQHVRVVSSMVPPQHDEELYPQRHRKQRRQYLERCRRGDRSILLPLQDGRRFFPSNDASVSFLVPSGAAAYAIVVIVEVAVDVCGGGGGGVDCAAAEGGGC